jgi:hypothetical protein
LLLNFKLLLFFSKNFLKFQNVSAKVAEKKQKVAEKKQKVAESRQISIITRCCCCQCLTNASVVTTLHINPTNESLVDQLTWSDIQCSEWLLRKVYSGDASTYF